MSGHIVKSYDLELQELEALIVQMGELAISMLTDSFEALDQRELALADRTVNNDRTMDALELQIQEQAIAMIAKRQPLADDLRHIMTMQRIAGNLERIGDLTKNIAKRAHAVAADNWPRALSKGLSLMADHALLQLRETLDAMRARDDAKALRVWHADVRLDDLYDIIFRDLLTFMMQDSRSIGACTHLLFVAKNLERVGDHATNIAENTHYLVTGSYIREERPKGASAKLTTPPKPSN
jgi:phosphate transport system protein